MHEFKHICQSDHDEFETQYPGLSNQYAKLCKAISIARKARGELQERPRKKPRIDSVA